MKQRKFLSFAMASVLGLATGVPMQGLADDTEIYTGGSAVEGVRPNILLILDTSGSMDAFDGETKDRLDRMKDAVTTLLEGVDNVNMGLMRFTDPGGPILFPVSAIDSDADAVGSSGQPDVVVQITDDSDDVEELVTYAPSGAQGGAANSAILNDVMLDSAYLELPWNGAFGPEERFLTKVGDDNDDAEQRIGYYGNGSSDLDLGNSFGRALTIGMLFEDAPGDTAGATVLYSRILLTPDADRTGTLNTKIFGHYGWDAPSSFSANADGPGGCPVIPGAPGQLDAMDLYCLAGLDTVAEYNTGISYDNVASYSHTAGTGLVTDAIVTWDDVPETVAEDPISTPDIGPILQEIFSHPFYKSATSDDDLALFITSDTTGSHRDFYSDDGSGSRAPELLVDYVPAGASTGHQIVAFRFRNVLIPSLAAIESASLELVPVGDSTVPVNIRISAELVPSATAFTAYEGGTAVTAPATDRPSTRIMNRRTMAAVDWNLTAAATDAWSHESPVQTPDLSSILKEVVAQGGWCGGNDLVVFMEYSVPPPNNGSSQNMRRVFAHDADPTKAASLQVSYDKKDFDPGEGCTTDTVVRRVAADRDDAREFPSFSGFVELSGNTMITPTHSGYETVTGAIFRSISIPPGATITHAAVEFSTSASESAGSSTLRVRGRLQTGEIDEFSAGAYNVSSRTNGADGTAHVDVSVPPTGVSSNEPFQTPDISAVIQTLMNQTDWGLGDDMLLTFSKGSGSLNIKSHDSDPSRAPALIIDMQYNVGDVLQTLPAGQTPGITTVRQRLKEILATFKHNGYTPIVDTLYEAARYYRGEGVVYGASRGDGGSSVERNTRISHKGSYTGGTVVYPSGCNTDDSNLNDEDCRNQRITDNPVYKSPIEESCQSNFIVLLTDGQANHNHSQSRITSMAGSSGSCHTKFSNGDNLNFSNEECGVDLARFLYDNDQSSDVAGNNNITTYTIGFNLAAQGQSTQFLRDIAAVSDGQYFDAGTESQLLSVFQAIIADVLSRATSFAAPSLSVNAFNRLEDRNEVYFSLFEPSATTAWFGNIKKFQLCQSENDACHTVSGAEVGDILDARPTPLIAVGTDGRILDTALSFWTGAADGPEVLKGGTGEQLHGLGHASRRVFTLANDAAQPPLTPLTATHTFTPHENLAASRNELVDANANGILDGLEADPVSGLIQTRALLGLSVETPAQISEHINWIRGKDVDDKFNDAQFGSDRWAFGDPLHGNPLAITFGGTEDDPIVKLLAGTNDGGIRLTNSNNGKEEWVFFPPELLHTQQDLRANQVAAQRLYGVDGTATPWIRDTGEIGVIDPADGDFVRIFIGMRRGGNTYYGLDITPQSRIADNDTEGLANIQPKVMWRIRGGTPEFPMLGESWSRPVLASMLVGTATANQAERRAVLIFAGGYEPSSQDAASFGKTSAASGIGNAIYVVDAETGERLFFVGGPGALDTSPARHSAPRIGIEIADMEYPIPSDVTAFDSDGDGSVDRVYVGDTGGQMWRVDFFPDRSNSPGIIGVAGRLATVSFKVGDADNLADEPADERKFFYPPSVIEVRGAERVQRGLQPGERRDRQPREPAEHRCA